MVIFLQYPVSKFVQLLGFDDHDTALHFLECYNVRRINDLDTGEELMLISKTRLVEPIEDPPSRIHSWIEMKRHEYTVTEVNIALTLCGKILSENEKLRCDFHAFN